MPLIAIRPYKRQPRRSYALSVDDGGYVHEIRSGKIVVGTIKEAKRFKSMADAAHYGKGVTGIHVSIVNEENRAKDKR